MTSESAGLKTVGEVAPVEVASVLFLVTERAPPACISLDVLNNKCPLPRPFDFTAALHTYIEVLEIAKAKVTGLKGEGG